MTRINFPIRVSHDRPWVIADADGLFLANYGMLRDRVRGDDIAHALCEYANHGYHHREEEVAVQETQTREPKAAITIEALEAIADTAKRIQGNESAPLPTRRAAIALSIGALEMKIALLQEQLHGR